MKVKALIIYSFLMLITIAGYSQEFPSQLWHTGKIVLIDGDTLSGQLRYSQETDIVEYMSNSSKKAQAYTGRKILYFEIFDSTIKQYREFYALTYALNGNYETPVLFEVIIEDKPVTLLSREKIQYQVVTSPYAFGGTYSRLELVYTYYFVAPDKGIQRFDGTRKEVEDYFTKYRDQVTKYMKKNSLKLDKRKDLTQLVMYNNSLYSSSRKDNK